MMRNVKIALPVAPFDQRAPLTAGGAGQSGFTAVANWASVTVGWPGRPSGESYKDFWSCRLAAVIGPLGW